MQSAYPACALQTNAKLVQDVTPEVAFSDMEHIATWPRYRLGARGRLLAELRVRLHLAAHARIGADRWGWRGIALPANAIYLVLGGDAWYEDRARRAAFVPGRAYLLPAQTPLSLGCATGIDKLWVAFDLELFAGRDLLSEIEEVIDLGPFDAGEPDTVRQAARGSTPDWLRLEAWCLEKVSRLGERLDTLVDRQARLALRHRRLLDYLTHHLDARLRVSELAEQLGVSAPHLSRTFRADLGLSLKDYIEEELNRRAQAMLAFEDARIKEVATALGFPDQQAFARFFGRRNGCSPSRFRAAHRG
jgi:AraC-like DNA-binding protein